MADDQITVSYGGRTISFEALGAGNIERELRLGRFYEMQMLQYVESLGLSGAYVDVGGGVGTHSVFFAAFCPSTRVHTFEPRRRLSDMIERNVKSNGLSDRVRLHNVGLSTRREAVSVQLDGKLERIECVPLDEVVNEPVSVMKIDVEGMEPAVLGGAARILRESKPVVLVEAHTPEEVRTDAALLAPYGYRLTGRVFNSSATYEFAAPDSRMAPVSAFAEQRSLMRPELWVSDHPAVEVSCSEERLLVRSRLPQGAVAHVTQSPPKLKVPPPGDTFVIPHGRMVFLQAGGSWGIDSQNRNAVLHVMQYAGQTRNHVSRAIRHVRLFWKIELQPDTAQLRVVLRLEGSGEHALSSLALHVAAPRAGD